MPPSPQRTGTFECDACNCQMIGYPMRELMVDHGWRLHSAGRGERFFVMCGDCEKAYAARREAAGAA